ncbi:MAG TPA: hypothetical protein VMW09_04825 [Desulfatiglandales bacterium]|nr:hypothetical protein [Desulfatiglandales bacterium]
MIQLKKFITGKEVLGILDIKPFQLFELVKGVHLQIYNEIGRLTAPPNAQKNIDELGNRLQKEENELERLKNAWPLLRLRDKVKSKKTWESKLSEGPVKGIFVFKDMSLAQEDLDYCHIREKRIEKTKSKISNIDRSWRDFELPVSGATEVLNYVVDSFYLEEEVQKHQRFLPEGSYVSQPKDVEQSEKFPDLKLKKEEHFKNPFLMELLREVKPEMEFLFNELQDAVGFQYANNPDREKNLQKEAESLLADPENKLNRYFIKEYFQDQKIYSTDPKQTRRDFIGPLLRKIVKDQIKIKIGGQRLYERYKEI